MALIVEDGTGRPDAESYCTVAFADEYHAARGNAAWAALSPLGKEIALRKATDFMLSNFGSRWVGTRATALQALDWPRAYVPALDGSVAGEFLFSTVIPVSVQRACAYYADPAITALVASAGAVSIKEKKLGPATFKYTSDDRAARALDVGAQMLLPFMARRSVFGQVFAERA
jgi:hypothetical protein